MAAGSLPGALPAGRTPRDGTEAVPLAPAPTEALDDLVARFREAGLPVRLTHSGEHVPDDAPLRLAVYRIAQEALTNVLRYAPTSRRIEVTVVVTDEVVTVTIENGRATGTSAPTVTGSGRGLIGMRERVAVFGGSLEAGPTAEGWRVEARLPHDSARMGP